MEKKEEKLQIQINGVEDRLDEQNKQLGDMNDKLEEQNKTSKGILQSLLDLPR